MDCRNHMGMSAADNCVGCAEPFCANCLVEIQDQRYCGECKVMAIDGNPLLEEMTTPCPIANEALKYAIIGFFCFGIIFGPIAINKALAAKKNIAANLNMTGRGKANAAIFLGICSLIFWVIGIIARVNE